MVRAIDQPQDKAKCSTIKGLGNLAAILPIQINYVGHDLQVLLKNGMTLQLAVNRNYEISIEKILLSPIERTIQIKK